MPDRGVIGVVRAFGTREARVTEDFLATGFPCEFTFSDEPVEAAEAEAAFLDANELEAAVLAFDTERAVDMPAKNENESWGSNGQFCASQQGVIFFPPICVSAHKTEKCQFLLCFGSGKGVWQRQWI